MCGIIGYLGSEDFKQYVLTGLALIQNRGYDSVGISYINDNVIHTYKKASVDTHDSLKIVSEYMEQHESTIAIGHTRWATHGGKTDINAHPHSDIHNTLVLAHNGIIENYLDLRTMLENNGYSFISQTDTEVISNLIHYYYKGDMKQAITDATNELSGTWALVIIHKDYPNKMWVTRHGSPILLGLNENFAMIVSEQTAFGNHITKFVPIENYNVVEIVYNDGITYSTKFNEHHIITKSKVQLERNPSPYDHWMIKEIMEQPKAIMGALNNGARIPSNNKVKLGGLELHKDLLMETQHLILLGCGTSYNAGLWSLNMFKRMKVFDSITLYDGAEFTEYDIPRGNVSLVLLSQSGETRDLIRCLDIAKQHSLTTIGIVNVVDSFIARETTCGIYLNAGMEVAVASTKSFTNQCIVLTLLCLWFAQNKGIYNNTIITDLRKLCIQMEYVLSKQDVVNTVINHIDVSTSSFLLGKGQEQAIANEGALKLKEIAYMNAQGYSSSALKHGPFALIIPKLPIFIIDVNYEHHDKNMSAYNEVKARGANVYLISCHEETIFDVPQNTTFGGLLANIYFQLISYKLALRGGYNPDYPRNLAKVVTVD